MVSRKVSKEGGRFICGFAFAETGKRDLGVRRAIIRDRSSILDIHRSESKSFRAAICIASVTRDDL